KGEYLEIENIAPKGLLHINFLNKNKLDEIAQILNIDFDDFLKEKQPYLETNKIQSLASQGFTFGGHSLNHPLFSEIPLSEKVRQATESTIFAKRITAQKTGAFAFPFTDFGVENTFFNKIFREKNIDISFGTAGLKQQRYAQHWQRFPMEEGEGTAQELVKTEYLYYMVKRLFGKHF
ncbi:MAG: peptidoglycan/xylan/chitin deacetylase (PgdA/CDA1 family), partial [Saprospiraceae bacterium]